MLYERRKKIIQMISSERTVKVNELTKIFNVSSETIRRDLQFLEEEGYLNRLYGGAVIQSMSGQEPDYSTREIKNYHDKLSIGIKAAQLVDDGDTIGIDIGTTTLEFAKALRGKKDITVITNGIQIAMALANDENIRVILLGGEVRKGELSTSGFMGENDIALFNMDKLFLGIGGITLESGVTDYHMEESNLRRHVLKKAHKIIGLADHSKFGIIAMNKVCSVEKLDIVVTDDKANKTMVARMREAGIRIIVGETEREF